jgi:hypothetical protein
MRDLADALLALDAVSPWRVSIVATLNSNDPYALDGSGNAPLKSERNLSSLRRARQNPLKFVCQVSTSVMPSGLLPNFPTDSIKQSKAQIERPQSARDAPRHIPMATQTGSAPWLALAGGHHRGTSVSITERREKSA